MTTKLFRASLIDGLVLGADDPQPLFRPDSYNERERQVVGCSMHHALLFLVEHNNRIDRVQNNSSGMCHYRKLCELTT